MRARARRGDATFPYVAYEELAERPHVMVDGAARPASVLALSHWPRTPTPALLARDLSTEIALAYLALARAASPSREERRQTQAAWGAEAVTCDHFDEDGVLSLLVLTDPHFAVENERLIVAAARCGDFGVVENEEAARIAFSIGPLGESEAGSDARDSEKLSSVLPRVRELCRHPERFARLHEEELARYRSTREAVSNGRVRIETYPEDLAVVSREATAGGRVREELHEAAIHSATTCNRVLVLGDGPELYLRYESWVRFVSRPVPRRPDLQPLALRLTSLEPGGNEWEATGPGAIVSRLRPKDGASELSPEVLVDCVRSYLAEAPPAWDPFASALGGGRRRPGRTRSVDR